MSWGHRSCYSARWRRKSALVIMVCRRPFKVLYAPIHVIIGRQNLYLSTESKDHGSRYLFLSSLTLTGDSNRKCSQIQLSANLWSPILQRIHLAAIDMTQKLLLTDIVHCSKMRHLGHSGEFETGRCAHTIATIPFPPTRSCVTSVTDNKSEYAPDPEIIITTYVYIQYVL